MPRSRYGDGSTYQVADGSWRASVDLGRDAVSGKRVRKVVRGRTRRDVDRKITDLRDRHRAGDLTVAPGSRLTVGGWLDQWLTGPARQQVSEDTLRRYQGLVDHQIRPALGHLPLSGLRPEQVERLYADLASTPRSLSDPRPLADATIVQAHRVLARAVKVAHRRGYVGRDVMRLVDPPRIRTRSAGRALTLPEARQLLTAAGEGRMGARWSVALAIGARQGETLGMRWDDVDWSDGTLVLARQVKRRPWQHGCTPAEDGGASCGEREGRSCTARHSGGLYLAGRTKSGKTSTVPLPAFLLAALRDRRREQAAERLAAGPVWNDHGFEGLIFSSALGRPLDLRADHAAWQALLARTGIPAARLHDARHTAATLLTAAGVDTAVIQTILGHSSAATTARYQHIGVEVARPAMTVLDGLLGGQAAGP